MSFVGLHLIKLPRRIPPKIDPRTISTFFLSDFFPGRRGPGFELVIGICFVVVVG